MFYNTKGFNPLYIGSVCNDGTYGTYSDDAGFNPLYIGSVCNDAPVVRDKVIDVFQSPLYRVSL